MQDNVESLQESHRIDKLLAFAREHPGWSAVGAAGIGLLGGVELAAGVLIGAGVAALLRVQPAHGVRFRAGAAIRERARAVVDAFRGRGAPEHGTEPTRESVDTSPL